MWKILVCGAIVVGVAGCTPRSTAPPPVPAPGPGGFSLTSPAFTAGSAIPAKFTCDGANVSPALHWERAPDGTRGFALEVLDPDAPGGTFTHWVLANIPAELKDLPEGASGIGVPGTNDFGKPGYGGPCPPSATHHYRFILSALDVDHLKVKAGLKRDALEGAMKGHVLGQAELVGTYSH